MCAGTPSDDKVWSTADGSVWRSEPSVAFMGQVYNSVTQTYSTELVSAGGRSEGGFVSHDGALWVLGGIQEVRALL